MAQETPPRWREWLHVARANWPVYRQQLADWWAEVREDPQLILGAPWLRYVGYVVGGIVLLLVGRGLLAWIGPPPSDSAERRVQHVDYHVICTNPDCGHHFVLRREKGYGRWPATCPACEQRTGEEALRCNSPACQGRWVLPIEEDGRLICPHCREPLGE